MQRLWSLGRPAAGRMVYESLREKRSSAYTTVTTVLGILREKGWLRRERRGRMWEYEPTVTREQYLAGVMLRALDDTDDRETLFARMAEGLSPQDLRALQAALRKAVTGHATERTAHRRTTTRRPPDGRSLAEQSP